MSEDRIEGRHTVLVVDDAPESLSLLSDALDRAGYTVLFAVDGAAALDLLDQITPDLVLMDAVMPGMSGFEACKRLKREKLLADVPVIFMTGLADAQHVVEGLGSGGVDYVTKPLVLEVLLARIRVHLENARLAQDAREALDASGRFLLAVDRTGHVLWSTRRARQLLGCAEVSVPASALTEMLDQRRRGSRAAAGCRFEIDGRALECSLVSSLGPDELLVRLCEAGKGGGEQAALQSAFALTARESEVLLWLSRGKSNRDIGAILEISPRTVNKHLEPIFVKLGVENRAAAAALAARALLR